MASSSVDEILDAVLSFSHDPRLATGLKIRSRRVLVPDIFVTSEDGYSADDEDRVMKLNSTPASN